MYGVKSACCILILVNERFKKKKTDIEVNITIVIKVNGRIFFWSTFFSFAVHSMIVDPVVLASRRALSYGDLFLN